MVDYIDTVVDYFRRMKLEYRCVRKTPATIRGIELYHQQPAEGMETDVLYVASEWNGELAAGRSLLVLTEDPDCGADAPEGCNLILLLTLVPPEQLVSLLSIWLESYIRSYDSVIRQRLIRFMSSKDSLSKIVNLASEWLENPVAVMDMSHNALEWMRPTVYPEELKDFFQDMHPSEALLQTIVSSGYNILNQLLSHKAAIMTPKDLPRNYICLIFVKNVAIAGISVMELNRPFHDADYDKIQFLSTLLSQELQKTKYNTINRVHRQRSFFYDILRGNPLDEADLNERLRYFQLPLLPFNHLLAVDIRSMPKEEQEQIINELSILRGDLAILFDGYAVLLVSTSEPGSARVLQSYTDFLSLRRLRAGVSSSFNSLKQAKLYFLQACSAIIWGTRLEQGDTIFHYDDYAINHIISQCEPAFDLMHPALKTLAAYDRANGTCLIATLYTYLKNDRSTAKSGEKMHVHRNTVRLRLGKIKQMLPVDWNDSAQVRYVFLSLIILECSDPELFQRT